MWHVTCDRLNLTAIDDSDNILLTTILVYLCVTSIWNPQYRQRHIRVHFRNRLCWVSLQGNLCRLWGLLRWSSIEASSLKIAQECMGRPYNGGQVLELISKHTRWAVLCNLISSLMKIHQTAEGTRLQLVSSVAKTTAVVVSTLMEAWELIGAGLVVDGTVSDVRKLWNTYNRCCCWHRQRYFMVFR